MFTFGHMLYLLSLFLSPKYTRPFPVVFVVVVLCIFHIRSFILVEKAIVAHAKIRVTYVILVNFVDLSTQLKYIQQKCTRKKNCFHFWLLVRKVSGFFSAHLIKLWRNSLMFLGISMFNFLDEWLLLFFIILAHRAILWQVSLIFNQSTVKKKTFQTINWWQLDDYLIIIMCGLLFYVIFFSFFSLLFLLCLFSSVVNVRFIWW